MDHHRKPPSLRDAPALLGGACMVVFLAAICHAFGLARSPRYPTGSLAELLTMCLSYPSLLAFAGGAATVSALTNNSLGTACGMLIPFAVAMLIDLMTNRGGNLPFLEVALLWVPLFLIAISAGAAANWLKTRGRRPA